MSDALPLPPRPTLNHYQMLARDLQRAASDADTAAFRRWAARWLESAARLQSHGAAANDTERVAVIERVVEGMERRWRDFIATRDRGAAFKPTDAQLFLAQEHGFASWPAFTEHIDGLADASSPVALFESAVDAIVSGNEAILRALLESHPELVRARSTRAHRSTLLHYVSANGVEDFRQVTPDNIVAITEMLLAAGADVNASSEAYGGGSTTLGLVATSVHPEQAGVQIELLETLLRHGASIEGEQAGNGHGIILGCLANGQPRAAAFFADRGAPMNLIEASGVGRIDHVKTFFDEEKRGGDRVTAAELDVALQYASGYGQADVVTLLLERGANAGMRDDAGQTPLHWATFGPHVEVTRALLAAGAPVDARDKRFNATPLDWMIHAWAAASGSDAQIRGRDVAALLVAAGAVPDLERFGPETHVRLRQDPEMVRVLGSPVITDEPAGPPGGNRE